MKIIKQNDSAGGLIFKQNTGGKAMKQNYTFNKGFTSTGTIYLKSSYIPDFSHPFSMVFWNNVPPSTSDQSLFSTQFSAINSGSLILGSAIRLYNNTFVLTKSTLFNSGTATNVYTETKGDRNLIMSSFVSDGVNLRFRFSGGSGITIPLSSLPSNTIDTLYFAITRFAAGLVYEKRRLVDIKVFSRAISDTELNYLENLGLGNEPLSVVSLEVWHTNSSAEILHIEGVEKIGIRDIARGVNHSEVVNLPVGTLEDQLSYANANLF